MPCPTREAPLASARTGVRTNNSDRTTKRQRTQRSPSSSAQREARLSFPLGRTGDAMPHATCHMLFWGSVFYMPSDFGDLNYTNQTRLLCLAHARPLRGPRRGWGGAPLVQTGQELSLRDWGNLAMLELHSSHPGCGVECMHVKGNECLRDCLYGTRPSGANLRASSLVCTKKLEGAFLITISQHLHLHKRLACPPPTRARTGPLVRNEAACSAPISHPPAITFFAARRRDGLYPGE